MRFGFFQLGDIIDCAQYYNDRQVDNSWPSVGLKGPSNVTIRHATLLYPVLLSHDIVVPFLL